jgi:hypothetical protein
MGEQKKELVLSIMLIFVLVSFPFVGSVGASFEMWNQTYGYATSDEDGCSLVATSDGGYAILGYTGSMASELFWLVKTDEMGYVPEYSSWLISTLLLATTVIIIVYRTKQISGCKQSQTATHKCPPI